MFRVLLFLFLVMPLVEIYVLIRVGESVGPLTTVALVVLTAVLGALLLRLQGFTTLRRVQGALARGEVPAVELVEGAILLICGALLLTPGFVTDVAGFLGLVPPIRHRLAAWFVRRALIINVGPRRRGPPRDKQTLEGEYRELEDRD